MDAAARIINTTIKKHLRKAEDAVLRNRKVYAMVKQKGRISYNNGGNGSDGDFDWRVRYKEAQLQSFIGGDTLTFVPQERYKVATLPYRGYAMVDSMNKMDRLRNRGTEAIVKVYEEMTKLLMRDWESRFNGEFYIDGNASGNTRRFHGIESFFNNTGVGTAVPVATADDSYAGLDTDLGAYGGTWSGNWPLGSGDAQYDFWTPLLVDYTSAITTSASNLGWSASTKTWDNTCQEAIRFGITHTMRNEGMNGQIDLILLWIDGYRRFIEHQDPKERIIVEKNLGLRNLGFRDVINFDGVEVTSEFDIATGVGYGLNFSFVELLSMQDQLIVPTGPDYDIATQTDRFSLDTFGNFRFDSPRNMMKLKNYS